MTSAKRILLAVTQAHWGGVQSFLVHFAQDLQKEGHTVLLAAAGEGDLWERAQQAGVPTRRLQYFKREISPLSDWAAIGELERLLQDFKPDAVHLNSSKMGILGSIACRALPHPPRVVYRIGGWSFLEPIPEWKKWIYRQAEKKTAPFKDVIITVHPGDEALGRKLGFKPKEKIVTVPNGLELETFQSQLLEKGLARELLNLPLDSFVFGTVSNAYATKGLVPYLSQIDKLLQDYPQAHLAILGDGPLFDEIKRARQASTFRERIHLYGQRKDAVSLYGAFDAFVLPSVKEGMPWAILEAMASKLPCIATDVGACRWMIEGGESACGFIIPPQDQSALHASMKNLLDDSIFRQQFAEAAIQNVRSRFTWERTFQGNRDALISSD